MDGQNLKYFVNLSKQKMAIFNLIRTKLYRIHGRIVINACVKYRKKIFIGVGDIHPDGQISDRRTETQTDGRTEPKSLSPTKKYFWWGIISDNTYI